MNRNLILILFLFLSLVSCRINSTSSPVSARSNANRFVADNHLNQYDSIYLVACISCKGCIEDFFEKNLVPKNCVMVFDTNCKSSFINAIKEKDKYVSVSQKEVTKYFGVLGNISLITKSGQDYEFRKIFR